MRQAQIFISYRRDDAAGYARAIYDALAREFTADKVFIDVDDIDAGQAFADVIRRAVGESQVLLVLIGKQWLGERPGTAPRLFDPGDFVRLEVEGALAHDMRIIPLLLDGAPMPTEAQLPPSLQALAGRNGLEVGNTRFAADMARLIAALRETVTAPAEPAPQSPGSDGPAVGSAGLAPRATPATALPSPARRWALVAAAMLVLAAVGWTLLKPVRTEAPGGDPASSLRPGPADPAAATTAARPDVNGEWQAEVDYDWPGAHHIERFSFIGSGTELQGSASFLGVRRGLLEGRIGADGLRFVTRTGETTGVGGGTAELVHRYRAEQAGDSLKFTMQTEGGVTPHVPVEFTARRVAAAGTAPKP